MRASAQGQAYLKKRAASGEAPAPAPASSAAKTGSEEKNARHHPAAAQKPRAASVPASVPGGSGLEHARIAHPPPATLVACEASKARGGDAGPAARRAPASARDAAPGTPPRAEPRARALSRVGPPRERFRVGTASGNAFSAEPKRKKKAGG